MLVYRLHSSRYLANNGKGAAITGGRWNPKGFEAIYTASSRALAALEIMVHYAVLPRDFVMTTIRIPVTVSIRKIEEEAGELYGQPLPEISVSQEIARKITAAVLSVPSAVIPGERNYVINPTHPDFHLIEFDDPVPFQFDPRLMR